MPRGPLKERCRITNLPIHRLDPLGPDWVDDCGVRADQVPTGLVALPPGSLSALVLYRNQTEGVAAIRGDPRWQGHELFLTSLGSVVQIQHGYQVPPAGASSLGIFFDNPSSLSWLGERLHEEAHTRKVLGKKSV